MEYLYRQTILPLKIFQIATSIYPKILVTTPHRGMVEINLREKHLPFLFGSVTETDKNLNDIINELKELEEQSKIYLLNKWKNNINQNDNK